MQDALLDDDFVSDQTKKDFDPQEALRINRIITEVNDRTKRVKHGRNALWVLVLLQIIGCVVAMVSMGDTDEREGILIASVIVVVLFSVIAGGFQFNKKIAIISGLGLYGLLILIDAIAMPSSIIRGILVKIAMFYFLIRAVGAIYQNEDYKSQLSRLGVSQSDLTAMDDLRDVRKVSSTIDFYDR